MKNLAKPICNFCKLPIEYGPGFMMVEDLDLPDGGFDRPGLGKSLPGRGVQPGGIGDQLA